MVLNTKEWNCPISLHVTSISLLCSSFPCYRKEQAAGPATVTLWGGVWIVLCLHPACIHGPCFHATFLFPVLPSEEHLSACFAFCIADVLEYSTSAQSLEGVWKCVWCHCEACHMHSEVLRPCSFPLPEFLVQSTSTEQEHQQLYNQHYLGEGCSSFRMEGGIYLLTLLCALRT